jgi:hypothetical protein
MLIDSGCWAEVVPSVTFTVKEYEPTVVGVPAMLEPASESPGGSDPVLIDQVYVPEPPVALSGCE